MWRNDDVDEYICDDPIAWREIPTMIKRIELCESYIIPKGLLGFYITIMFLLFEEKRVKPFVHFDKHTFYTMCRKDWEWGQNRFDEHNGRSSKID